MYRTGDRARWTSAGVLEYLGRTDRQIKLRGIRIEPEEIEAALRELPGVRDAVVRVHAGDAAEARLVGYVVAKPGESIEGRRLRRGLQRRLPARRGPFDHPRSRCAAEIAERQARCDVSPDTRPGAVRFHRSWRAGRGTPAEQQLIKIWSSLLGVDRIGPDDNFFDLGGHSLHATRVISRIRDVFRVELSVRDLFLTPTVAGLASAVTEAQTGRTSAGDVDRLPSVLAASDRGNGEQHVIREHRYPPAGDLAAKKG